MNVVIAGGGPVGLMLACELRLYEINVTVIERLTEIDQRAKAGALQGRAVELLQRRGLLDRLPDNGPRPATGPVHMMRGHFAGIWALRESAYETAPPMILPQQALEAMLTERAAEIGVDVRRGDSVVSYEQNADGIDVEIEGPDGPYRLRAEWLVGADGGRSLVRKLTGIPFPGTDGIITGYQALVELDDPDFAPRGWTRFPGGLLVNGPFPGRILVVEFDGPPADRDASITLEEVQAAVRRVSGTTVSLRSASSLTRFTDNARLADSYRSGRVLLVGDAAHVHSPFGGQGLTLGLGDAVNLGWKLGLVARGDAPQSLLDTYTSERRPVADRVLDNTRAQVALMFPGPHTDALREIFTRLLDHDDANRWLTDQIGGADIRYDLGSDDDLVGRDVPPSRKLADLMRTGRGLLLGTTPATGWEGRVDFVRRSETSMLIRPDGHIAWTSADSRPLTEALETWFGPAA